MIRVSRYLLPTLLMISFSLCALTFTLWLRSYSGSDYLSRNRPIVVTPDVIRTQVHAITFTRGSVRLTSQLQHVYPGRSDTRSNSQLGAFWTCGRLGPGHLDWHDPPGNSFWNRLGFYAYSGGVSTSFWDTSIDGIAFPTWMLTTLFGLPPILWLTSLVKRRLDKRSKHCPHCGYDLRATPERCPECGRTAI